LEADAILNVSIPVGEGLGVDFQVISMQWGVADIGLNGKLPQIKKISALNVGGRCLN